jgi:hypothetical protein
MARRLRTGEPRFSHPVQQLTLMVTVLLLVGAGGWLAYGAVAPVVLANVWLNGGIFLVFLIGVTTCFLQVFQMSASVRWIESFANRKSGQTPTAPPRLLVSLAALLSARGGDAPISATSARSILDSVATRIDEVREITRYIVSLLIFLGLLGTFFGLATTVPAVVDTIRSLAPAEGDSGMAVFDRLMTGLESQLSGLGTAFSSSLLGLAGSLVVGLLELFAGQSQNRFYRELEEWLSSFTRLGLAGGDGDASGQASVLAAVLDQMAGQMETMQVVLAEAEAERAQLDSRLGALAAAMERVAGRLESDAAQGAALDRVAKALTSLAESGGAGGTIDAETRLRLRSIDVQLVRILEELAAGRQEMLADLRTDIAGLTGAVRQMSRSGGVVVPVRPTGRTEG